METHKFEFCSCPKNVGTPGGTVAPKRPSSPAPFFLERTSDGHRNLRDNFDHKWKGKVEVAILEEHGGSTNKHQLFLSLSLFILLYISPVSVYESCA